MKAYLDHQIVGDYASAWAMLSPAMQSSWQTLAAFTIAEAGFQPTAKEGYTLTANPKDYMSLTDWLAGQPFASAIDTQNAVLILVQWTALPNNNAGWEMWVANPTPAGWELYEVR
ncbi:MAG: hypothetical protein ABSG37_00755 [Candidatus Limnocylindrales bacterium]|jgi:hypothetical protein